jgi:hypothetical protein
MWVARVQARADKMLIGGIAARHGVTVTGYPISSYPRDGSIYSVVAGVVFGEPDAKKGFLKDLGSVKGRVLRFEKHGDFFIALLKEPRWAAAAFYNPFIVFIRPAVIRPDGIGTYELGSWDRKELERFVQALKSYRFATLSRITYEDVTNIAFTNLLPELSTNQKHALELAVRHGYYDYPRRIGLMELARFMRTSLSTYREHLRRAEKKVMPKLVNHSRNHH